MGGGLFVRVELRHVDDRFVVEINRFIGLFVASYAHLEVKKTLLRLLCVVNHT